MVQHSRTITLTPGDFMERKVFIDEQARTYAPVEMLEELLRCSHVNQGQNDEKIIIRRNDKELKFNIAEKKMYESNSDEAISANVYLLSEVENMVSPGTPFSDVEIPYKFYVPVRLVAEAFGFSVDWDATNHKVIITEDIDYLINHNPNNYLYVGQHRHGAIEKITSKTEFDTFLSSVTELSSDTYNDDFFNEHFLIVIINSCLACETAPEITGVKITDAIDIFMLDDEHDYLDIPSDTEDANVILLEMSLSDLTKEVKLHKY